VLIYGLAVVGATDVLENLFYGRHYVSLAHLIYYLLMGIPVGLIGWSSMEGKYQKALNEARLKALPESKNSPASRA